MKKCLRVLSCLMILLLLCMIFSFSAETAEESGATSDIVLSIARKVLNALRIDDWRIFHVESPTHLIRKLAHFTEFFLLSFFAFLHCSFYSIKKKWKAFIPLAFTLLVAIADEIHQIFVPGRSGNIKDVLIDFAGGLFAAAFFRLLLLLIRRHREKKNPA